MTLPPMFRALPLEPGAHVRAEGVDVSALCGSLNLGDGGTSWVLAVARCELTWAGERWPVPAGGFAVVPGAGAVSGRGLVIFQPGWLGLFQLGAGVEARGRLAYIDGCTDTLLQSPPRFGDPCLNHLHIPAGTAQTAHTHPSVRVGTILRGHGVCVAGGERIALRAGLGWVIPTGLVHAFHTGPASLDVIAWHPDSDFGPTDAVHPMKNRTILD